MKILTTSAFALSIGLLLPACDRTPTTVAPGDEVVVVTPASDPVAKTRTLETSRLGRAVDQFNREPTSVHEADVKKAIAELDGEIAELQSRVSTTSGNDQEEAAIKLRNLQAYRAAEVARFTAEQARHSVGTDPGPIDPRTGAEKASEALQRTGAALEDAAEKTSDAIKDAIR